MFKVGDIVTPVEPPDISLYIKYGRLYRITKIWKNEYAGGGYLTEIDHLNGMPCGTYGVSWFKLSKEHMVKQLLEKLEGRGNI